MKKRVYLIHGWGGSPRKDWFLWVGKELKKLGFDLHVPEMPDTENPKVDAWVGHLKTLVPNPDKNIYFVGHSIGCQTILRYLESLPVDKIVGGIILVAPWVTLKGLEESEKTIAKPWLETPINWDKAKSHLARSFALFSDNDPVVPIENVNTFKDKLEAEVETQKSQGHFTSEDGVTELPIVVETLVKYSKE